MRDIRYAVQSNVGPEHQLIYCWCQRESAAKLIADRLAESGQVFEVFDSLEDEVIYTTNYIPTDEDGFPLRLRDSAINESSF